MTWWCFAQPGTAWTWQWRPLIGVWLVMLLLVWGYHRLLSRVDDSDEPSRLRKSRRFSFALAVFLLWASLDWPLGPLGASYLASVHMMQFLAVGIAAPALLLRLPPLLLHLRSLPPPSLLLLCSPSCALPRPSPWLAWMLQQHEKVLRTPIVFKDWQL